MVSALLQIFALLRIVCGSAIHCFCLITVLALLALSTVVALFCLVNCLSLLSSAQDYASSLLCVIFLVAIVTTFSYCLSDIQKRERQ